MDAKIKQEWIAALRSGEFKQGAGCLRTFDNCYCCLGVLCVVAGIEITEDGGNCVEDADKEHGGYGPLKEIVGDGYHLLYHLNDAGGKSFAAIADYIEKHL